MIDKKEQDRMVLGNLGLVRYCIRNLGLSVPEELKGDDIFQYGCIGLVEAVRDYRKERGAFSTFAVYKIRSAIIKGIRHSGCKWGEVSLDSLREEGREDEAQGSGERKTESLQIEHLIEKEALRQEIGKLSQGERAIIHLEYFSGIKRGDLLTVYKIPRRTREKYHRRAIGRLKDELII